MNDQQLADLQRIIGRQEEELEQARLREVALTERCERLELQVETEKAGPLMEQLAFLRQQLVQMDEQRASEREQMLMVIRNETAMRLRERCERLEKELALANRVIARVLPQALDVLRADVAALEARDEEG